MWLIFFCGAYDNKIVGEEGGNKGKFNLLQWLLLSVAGLPYRQLAVPSDANEEHNRIKKHDKIFKTLQLEYYSHT